jgi:hypothetical protein
MIIRSPLLCRATACLIVASLLAGCNSPSTPARLGSLPGTRVPVSPPLSPGEGRNTVLTPIVTTEPPAVETIRGSGRFTHTAGAVISGAGSGEPIEINLINTDIRSGLALAKWRGLIIRFGIDGGFDGSS